MKKDQAGFQVFCRSTGTSTGEAQASAYFKLMTANYGMFRSTSRIGATIVQPFGVKTKKAL
jgi:hypothetical protein